MTASRPPSASSEASCSVIVSRTTSWSERIGAGCRRQQARQQERRDRRDDAEAQRTGQRFSAGASKIFEVADGSEDVAGARFDLAPQLRQAGAAGTALDQRPAKGRFQITQLHGQRRLGNPGQRRGAAEMTGLGQGTEIAELFEREHADKCALSPQLVNMIGFYGAALASSRDAPPS